MDSAALPRASGVCAAVTIGVVERIVRKALDLDHLVSPRMVRALMIKYSIKEHYDDSAREAFKAASFSFRCGLSYRRKSNKKPISEAERIPKLQRWHARLRRRL